MPTPQTIPDVRCPRCESPILLNADYCHACRLKLRNQCGRCHAWVYTFQTYCHSCGIEQKPLTVAELENKDGRKQQRRNRRSRRNPEGDSGKAV